MSYRVTNILGAVAGFVVGGKQFVLQPGESVVVDEVPVCDMKIEKIKKINKKGD